MLGNLRMKTLLYVIPLLPLELSSTFSVTKRETITLLLRLRVKYHNNKQKTVINKPTYLCFSGSFAPAGFDSGLQQRHEAFLKQRHLVILGDVGKRIGDVGNLGEASVNLVASSTKS